MITNNENDKFDQKAAMEKAEEKESPEALWQELTEQELEVVGAGNSDLWASLSQSGLDIAKNLPGVSQLMAFVTPPSQ
jgi:hypothetical protein